jgi:hypothetical protein
VTAERFSNVICVVIGPAASTWKHTSVGVGCPLGKPGPIRSTIARRAPAVAGASGARRSTTEQGEHPAAIDQLNAAAARLRSRPTATWNAAPSEGEPAIRRSWVRREGTTWLHRAAANRPPAGPLRGDRERVRSSVHDRSSSMSADRRRGLPRVEGHTETAPTSKGCRKVRNPLVPPLT